MRDSPPVEPGVASQRSGRTSRAVRWAAVLAVLAAVAAPGGWIVTDALEADNDFCNACHFWSGDGRPLHLELRRDFDGRPPASLAALHGDSAVEGRPGDPAFRCIDCHRGVGFLGRARVKALAARDALVWLSGRFEEPTGMRHPLWDRDCRQCHAGFTEKGDGAGGPAFHDLSVHNVALGVACVECHASHDGDGDPDYYFLAAAQVRERCADCHPELAGDLGMAPPARFDELPARRGARFDELPARRRRGARFEEHPARGENERG